MRRRSTPGIDTSDALIFTMDYGLGLEDDALRSSAEEWSFDTRWPEFEKLRNADVVAARNEIEAAFKYATIRRIMKAWSQKDRLHKDECATDVRVTLDDKLWSCEIGGYNCPPKKTTLKPCAVIADVSFTAEAVREHLGVTRSKLAIKGLLRREHLPRLIVVIRNRTSEHWRWNMMRLKDRSPTLFVLACAQSLAGRYAPRCDSQFPLIDRNVERDVYPISISTPMPTVMHPDGQEVKP